ncbi:unnamed protein product [Meganyctiphanes norvegica]|uniref:RING-type E3 ubiquitin transferase n=1 Tax=Meganyctiphanes norvegica TaxID=48144 RepID=A0AAV2PK22_MEGNR
MSIGSTIMAPVVENVPLCDDEEVCVVCFRTVEIYSIGECDHPVCFECSTRMRVLISRNECPICRKEMDKVIFMIKVLNYAEINTRQMHLERRYNIYFETEEIMKCFDALLDHTCTICDNLPTFRNFNQLKDHMRKNHERFYCELCVEHLKIFTRERTSYSRSQLAQHRRKGDTEDKSHRGHPLCEFCDARFMDNDELFRHLRRDHFFCHFCDADGIHQYYEDYDALRDHFRSDHFLCEEGDCKEERFTAAFRSKIDIQAHINQVHSHNLSKAAARQARTVDIEFTVNHRGQEFERGGRGRGRGGRGGRGGRRERERDQDFEEIPPELLNIAPNPTPVQVDINCAQDFPSLNGLGPGPGENGGSSNKSMANKIAQQNRLTIRTGANRYSRQLHEDDFPTLSSTSVTVSNAGAGVPGTAVPITSSLHLKLNKTKGDVNQKNSGATNFSIQYNRTGDEVSGGVQVNGESGVGGTRLGVVSQNSNITLASTTKAKKKPVEDFPALGMSGKASSKSGGTLWGASAGPTVVAPKITPKVESQAKAPGRGMADFPSLGGSAKSVSSISNKPAKSFKAADFPNLAPVPPDQQQHMHNYHGKASVTIPVSNRWTNSTDHVPKPSGEPGASKGKKKKKGGNRPGSADSSNSSRNHNNNINNNSKLASKKKPVGLSNIFDNSGDEDDGGPKEDLSRGRVGEYESYGPAVANSNMKLITRDMIDNRKKSELKIGNLKPAKPAPTLDNEEAFPTLGGLGESLVTTTSWLSPTKTNNKKANNKSNNKKSGGGGPPPGFSNKPRVPPGFTATDMTFTSSSGEKFAISPTSETPEAEDFSPQYSSAYAFQLPPDFEQRNKMLIKSIQEECGGDSDKFTAFKRLAGELRSGYLGGKDYYRQCRQVMGKQTFHKILPELLVLLPDIRKQQEVLEGYRSLDGGRGCTALFAVCTICRQVLNSDDFGEHMSLHDQPSAEFPSLASVSSHML